MLWTVSPCLVLFVSFFMNCVSAGKQCREERSINGMALQGFVFKKFLVRALHECDVSCETEITCQSYNFVIGQKLCELNNRTKEARPENFRSDPTRFYKRRLSDRVPLGSIPELPAHSCQEIKASEGKDTISSKYWLDTTSIGKGDLIYCDMGLKDVDECITGKHDCDVNANCTNTVGGHNCTCKEGFAGDGRSCAALKNCAEIYKSDKRKDGVYTIKPDNLTAFDVFCDHTTVGGGWTVFQKRHDGSVDFFLNWSDYKVGFGDLNGEFWLGLDKIHRLTLNNNSLLRVDLEDFEGNTAYAEYNMFGVMSENDKYELKLGSYAGTAGDSLSIHGGKPFSTRDQDNDSKEDVNCAEWRHGAWWYNVCQRSNLNGIYRHTNPSPTGDGLNWREWKGYEYSLKRTEMKIRPVDF